MKVETFALILWDRTDGSMMSVEPMTGDNGHVMVTYPHYLIGSMDNLHEAIKGFGENVRRNFYFAYSEGHDITLEGDAIDIPNIGDGVVTIESQEVFWDASLLTEHVLLLDKYVVLPCVEDRSGQSLHDAMQQAVNPLAPRAVRRPVGAEGAEFWGLYRNEEDGTQAWMRDYATNEAAQSNAARMNYAHKEGKAEVL